MTSITPHHQATTLNGICPYFTMFPLSFPLEILGLHHQDGQRVIDPFCGRGTTNFASRLFGLETAGIDSSPVAVAIAEAKLIHPSVGRIVQCAKGILEEIAIPQDVPAGEFWTLAFHRDVLMTLCRLREGLLRDCRSDARKALRAIIMGGLHGPRTKTLPSYFSNQCQRTYAPKPAYAVKYWRKHGLEPQPVDVLGLIERRATRYYGSAIPSVRSKVVLGDSTRIETYRHFRQSARFDWVITSPPYYGMRTYIPDQWIRAWFVGGPAWVDYSSNGQIRHSSPDEFVNQLRSVWSNVGSVCVPGARLVLRFGAIPDRNIAPLELAMKSLQGTSWVVTDHRLAGSADCGRRQALHFSRRPGQALDEHDVWAVWSGSSI